MFSNFIEIAILAFVQGTSEFLPISSAAHLILVEKIYELENQSLLIDISLHLGSLLAILFYFKSEIFDLKKNKNLFYKIAIGTVPLILVGYIYLPQFPQKIYFPLPEDVFYSKVRSCS